jgi:hypothetical protein
MTNWDTPPDGLSPWNMSGFDKDEPFYLNDVLPPTVANTPHVATRLNDEQLIIATIDEFLPRKLCESVFLTSVVPIPYTNRR